jgi:predicted HicB family RNase H-like nuclease
VEHNSTYSCAATYLLAKRRHSIAPEIDLMKKPKSAPRTAAIRVRIKPSVKAMAEKLAAKEGRSIADWLERLIAAEKARRSKKQ